MARASSKRTSGIIKIAFVILAIYLLYILIGLKIDINAKKEELAMLDAKVMSQTAEGERLQSILDAEVDLDYIEENARKLGFVNSDEKVYESITD